MANSEIKMTMSLATAGVTGALGKMKTGISDFSSAAVEKLGNVAKYATGALVAGFTAAAKGALSYAKETRNLAEISSASVEEFQKMAIAAETVGISNTKLADIFKDVNDKVGDFLQAGSGPMVDFFENIAPQIGVTADQFKNLSGPQALQLYYDSLAKANLSQQEMTFYMEAIASDATALIPLLANGGQAFKEMGDAAEKAGLIMDQATTDSLASAEIALDKFSIKLKIFVGEALMGFQLLFAGAQQANWKDGILSLGTLLTGVTTGSMAAIKSGAAGIETFFDDIDQGASDAFDEMHGYAKGYQSSMSGTISEITGDWIEGIDSVTEADRRAHKARQKEAESLAKIQQKINAEEKKQAQSEMTAMEKLNATRKERIAIEKELEGIDPWSEDAANKELAIAKLQTEEIKLQVDAEEEAVASKLNKLDLELQIAKASGDPNRIAAAQKELDTETQIVALMNQHKIGREEATKILGNQNAHLETQKDLELQLLMAQANGNDALARELQGRIDKEKEALDIMEKFGISIEKARVIAAKLAGINAGPDVNNSGFVTPKEQRAFDKKQKALAKEEKARNRAEIAAERNVSKEKRRRPGLLDAKKARDKELQEQRDIKKAGEQALEDWKKQGANAPQMFDLDGNPLGPDGKPIPNAGPNAPGGGGGGGGAADPNAPGGGGGGGGGPAEPKKPANAVVDGLKPTLEDIKGELIKIEKHLQC